MLKYMRSFSSGWGSTTPSRPSSSSPAEPIGAHLGRFLAKLTSSRSSYVLTSKDAAFPTLWAELSEFGVFTELVYNAMPAEMAFHNLDLLVRPHFLLHGSDFIIGSQLLRSFGGSESTPAFTAYRPVQRQLVVAISGAQTLQHAWFFIQFGSSVYPEGDGCRVHSGLWKLYQRFKPLAISAVRSALEEQPGTIEKLVIVGHSMGGALGYLLALDLLADDANLLPPHLRIKLAFFGAPRLGNEELRRLWCKRVRQYREANGAASLQEYSVKINNDATPAIPFYSWGYRTFADTPLYSYEGRLYCIPPCEREHALFEVSCGAGETQRVPLFPNGGHTYYNDRDMATAVTRLGWLAKNMDRMPDWEERYREFVIAQGEVWS